MARLEGELFTNASTRKHRAELRFEVSDYDSTDSAISIAANVNMEAIEANAHLSPGDPLYAGNATYWVRFKRNLRDAENPAIIALLWPYLRSALTDQASRLGMSAINLPFALPPGIHEMQNGEVADLPSPSSD